MAAYAYYKAGKLPEAIAAAERYTTMHPGTKEAPLAHHIIAQSYFEQMGQPNRDQDSTRKALAQLKTLKTRYPDSTYAQKADNQIRLCEDTLAAQEMEVGRYYLKNGNHIAAINRFKTVITDYQTTAHVEEALYRLTATYMALGIAPEAQNARRRTGIQLPQLVLVQGILRAAAEAGSDASGQPGLVDDGRAQVAAEGPRGPAGRVQCAASHQAAAGCDPRLGHHHQGPAAAIDPRRPAAVLIPGSARAMLPRAGGRLPGGESPALKKAEQLWASDARCLRRGWLPIFLTP